MQLPGRAQKVPAFHNYELHRISFDRVNHVLHRGKQRRRFKLVLAEGPESKELLQFPLLGLSLKSSGLAAALNRLPVHLLGLLTNS